MDVTHLLTEEVARRWKISARTLEQWRWRGIGPQYRRLGGRVIYSVAEIERFEQSCDVEMYR